MKLIRENNEEIVFACEVEVSLANAIRRSVSEIEVVAIDEVEIYQNDSALYDEFLAHRLGLVPLKNDSIALKNDETIELKLKTKGGGEPMEVLSGELGDLVVHKAIPLVLLEGDQAIELVAKAKVGKGINHSKFTPGMMHYTHFPEIKISGPAEKNFELADNFPLIFEFDGKLKVKDASYCDLDQEDLKGQKGVEISFGKKLIIFIESWGQLNPRKILIGSCKALRSNLAEISKKIK